jgi:hypothetical protein
VRLFGEKSLTQGACALLFLYRYGTKRPKNKQKRGISGRLRLRPRQLSNLEAVASSDLGLFFGFLSSSAATAVSLSCPGLYGFKTASARALRETFFQKSLTQGACALFF